ncbi:MAG TPA: thiamine pyrophosphate-dependent enzyme [Hyphomicrobiaceae bacterium]|nr:thiamine pyrophosphate-dependent enzyme [Hyphomicrobiaceae bacterium]
MAAATHDPVRRTTATIVIERLIAHGIDTLYCLPGVQNDPFFDALFAESNRVRAIHTRHEQGAAYLALGAAMATGKPAAYCVVPGPGFLNTTAALSQAYGNNAPVLAISGQVPLAYVNRDSGFLHDIPDQLGIAQRLTKWSARISAPHEAATATDEAFRQMLAGRRRPAALECPLDVWGRAARLTLPRLPDPLPVPAPDDDAIAAAARALGEAARPLIIVGGGALDASSEVTALAEMLAAPVIAYRMGHGVVDARHALSLPFPAGHKLWGEADVVIGIGTRLHSQYTGWGVDDTLKLIRVEIDPQEMVRHGRPSIALLGDAAAVVRRLLDQVPAHNRKRGEFKDRIAALKAETHLAFSKLQPQLAYLEAIRAELPENGIFVDEFTQVGYVSRLAYPVYQPRTYLTLGYQGALGMGFPTALGAKTARPDLPVVSVNGDGGFMFNVQELATAVQFRIGVVSIVFNDNAFGNVRRMQKDLYGGRLIASDLVNPDFVRLAESFGAVGLRATSPAELRQQLRRGLKEPGPVVIEVPIGETPAPWDFIQLPRLRPPRRA